MLICAPKPRWPRPESMLPASCWVLTELTPACSVATWVRSRPFDGRSPTDFESLTLGGGPACEGVWGRHTPGAAHRATPNAHAADTFAIEPAGLHDHSSMRSKES